MSYIIDSQSPSNFYDQNKFMNNLKIGQLDDDDWEDIESDQLLLGVKYSIKLKTARSSKPKWE